MVVLSLYLKKTLNTCDFECQWSIFEYLMYHDSEIGSVRQTPLNLFWSRHYAMFFYFLNSTNQGRIRGVEQVISHFELTHKKNIRSKLPVHMFWSSDQTMNSHPHPPYKSHPLWKILDPPLQILIKLDLKRSRVAWASHVAWLTLDLYL